MRHLAPAISPPLAPRHIDDEVAILLVIEDALVTGGVRAGTGGERVDHALRNERRPRADPGLVGVQVLLLTVSISILEPGGGREGGRGANQSILLFMLPLHVLLLITHWIPPNIEQPLTPLAASDQEGPEVEATAVLRDNQVDALRAVIADGTIGDFIEVREFFLRRGVCDVERVVDVDITVCDILEMLEDVGV